MKLLIDMNLSPRWVGLLNGSGIPAVHWSSSGPFNAPDSAIMAYARENDYVVFTYDLDFGAILAATHGQKPSVVQVRSAEVCLDVIGPRVIAALRQMESALKEGALLTIDLQRNRLRLLPLPPRA